MQQFLGLAKKWQMRVFAVAILFLSTAMVRGARDIAEEARRRPLAYEQANAKLRLLSDAIATETSVSTARHWQHLAQDKPMFFLQACVLLDQASALTSHD